MLCEKLAIVVLAFLASSVAGIAISAPTYQIHSTSTSSSTKDICTVPYGLSSGDQANAQKCCTAAGGKSATFYEASLQGCRALNTSARRKYIGCIKDKLHETPVCSQDEFVIVPAKPQPTSVYCDVIYATASDQKVATSCCKSNGGKSTDLSSSKTERCANLFINGFGNAFTACIQDAGLQPACYPSKPSEEQYCSVDVTKTPSVVGIVERCCDLVGGFDFGINGAQQLCQRLTKGSKAEEAFVSCVKARTNGLLATCQDGV